MTIVADRTFTVTIRLETGSLDELDAATRKLEDQLPKALPVGLTGVRKVLSVDFKRS